MAHTFANLLVHVVFGTKNREPLIDVDLKPRLLDYLAGIIRAEGAFLRIGNGVADHVHLLVDIPATRAVADLVRVVKTNSSKWVHETFPDRASFGWQTGYGAFSVSASQAGVVARYIERQEHHHRTRTFREEFLAFLKVHGVPFDETRLWE